MTTIPAGWKLVEKKTCYVLMHDEDVIATLAGPGSEENAAIIASMLAAPASPVSTEINPDECDSEIYKRGTSVGLFDIPKEDANAICAGIAAATGARVDWHYIAGRVHIKALPAAAAGDAQELLDALKEARRELHSCQAVIHLAGGFDPAYVRDAQAAIKRADAAIAAQQAEQGAGE